MCIRDRDRLFDSIFGFEQGNVLVNEVNIPRPLDLGNHDHIDLVADVLDDLAQVIEYPGAVQGIDANPHRGVAEVVVAQQLDETSARGVLGFDRDGIFEVAAPHIALFGCFGGLVADLFDVRRKEMDLSLIHI